MLNKISIKFRMFFYILLTVLVFGIVSFLTQATLNQDAAALEQNSADLKLITASRDVNYIVNKEYTQLLLDINMGKVRWEDAESALIEGIKTLIATFTAFNDSLLGSDMQQSEKAKELIIAQDYLVLTFTSLKHFFTNNPTVNRPALNKFAEESMLKAADDVVVKMNAITDDKFNSIQQLDAAASEKANTVGKQILFAIAIGALIIVLFGIFLMYSIVKPTNGLTSVIKRLSDGEFDARAEVVGTDEIANLGTAFNGLLDDRAMTLTQIDEEHQELNQSVFSLLSAVAELSEKDLTIRAAVTEDATGPVADALNLLAQETSDTLTKVKNVAANVNEASNKVNSHLMSINKLAMKEQERAIDTADQMNIMIQKLDSISNSAANTNSMAGTATLSTKKAHESVTDTLSGMSDIRTTVQETGKKIKQLGERSQEISHVIEIIETIAERTTLLALNASMQAASAGDEGKGFSVIAEEIQRLAESSRESTGQISTLVRNIQQETNTTIETMDKTIEQVIDGSVKAADAADQMQDVLKTTSELVGAVDQIATASKDQVDISKDLKHKAESILKSTQVTGQELLSLTGLSRNMSEYAQQLVTSVDVFKLEDQQAQTDAANQN